MKNKLNFFLASLLIFVSVFSILSYIEKEDLKEVNSNLTISNKSQKEFIVVLEAQISERDNLIDTLKQDNNSLSFKYDSLFARFNDIVNKDASKVKIGDDINVLIEENVLPMYTKVASFYPKKVFTFRYGDYGFTTIITDVDYKIISFNRLEQLMEYQNTEGSE